MDLEKEEKGKIDALTTDFNRCKEELLTAKRDSTDMSESVIRRIEKEKEKCVRQFDNMIGKVRDTMKCNSQEIEKYNESVSDCKIKVQGTSNVKNRIKRLNEAEGKVKDICKMELTYNYFEHKKAELAETDIDRICGELVTKEVHVNLSGEKQCADFSTCGRKSFCFQDYFIFH